VLELFGVIIVVIVGAADVLVHVHRRRLRA